MKLIQLTQNKNAKVRDEDFDRINSHKWHAVKDKKTYYAVRSVKLSDGKWKRIWMHHEIYGKVTKLDHIDCDGLNNDIENLREATHSQNQMNRNKPRDKFSSNFKGVKRYSYKGTKTLTDKWVVDIRANGKYIYLGYFPIDQEEEAARTYDRAALRYHGEYAKLNFPREDYLIGEITFTSLSELMSI